MKLVGIELHPLFSLERRHSSGMVPLFGAPQPYLFHILSLDDTVTISTVSARLRHLAATAVAVGIDEWALHGISDPSDKSRSKHNIHLAYRRRTRATSACAAPRSGSAATLVA